MKPTQMMYDTYFTKTMGGFAIALGVELTIFIIAKVDVESYCYGFIALLAIMFGALSMLPTAFTYVVKTKEQDVINLRARIAELEDKAVIVETKEPIKPANKIQELINQLVMEQKGEK